MYEIDLLKKLVKFNTDARTRYNYNEIVGFLCDELRRLDIEAKIVGKEVPNIVAKLDVGASEDVAIVSHYDIVPADEVWIIDDREIDPFEPVEVNGRIYGRGTADNKAGIAATVGAFKELKGGSYLYNPVAVIVGDEEVGGLGVREVVNHVKVQYAIILDSSSSYIEIGASGVVHGYIKIYGKGGHAGYSHLCNNPVWKLADLIRYLRHFSYLMARNLSSVPSPPGSPVPYLWRRFNITMLRASTKNNIVPDVAEAGFDYRIVPGENVEEAIHDLYSFFNYIREKVGLQSELIIDYAHINPGWLTDIKNHFVQKAYKVALKAYDKVYGMQTRPCFQGFAGGFGGDDGYCFANRGVPTVGFGPIRSDCNIHGRNEFVYVKDLLLVKEYIKGMLE